MQVSVFSVLFSDGNDDNWNNLCGAAPVFSAFSGGTKCFFRNAILCNSGC